ncbi:endolytic transglycosylase MltG [Flexivirga sp. ID2601S]|uniref:Endolytic murein transglycosylase n=1 Tax=Flexivirga aerilata TaxID=1656889 RepID=A0A849APC9_9MICO|nr:endolytic transglycosylase MltG [Flexivirga aerilata]
MTATKRPAPDIGEDPTTAIPSREALRAHAENSRRPEDTGRRGRSDDEEYVGGIADLVGRQADYHGDDGHRPLSRKRAGRSCLVMVVALVLFIGALGFAATKIPLPHFGGGSSSAGGDYSGSGSGTVDITVKQGDSGGSIARTLVDAGVVKSAGAFLAVANGAQQFNQIQPGTYRLRKQMSASSAIQLMLDPKAFISTGTTIREGLWVDEIFSRLSKATGVPLADYKKVDPASLGLPAAANGKLEGYLFPSTYNFPKGATAQQQLKLMVDQGKRQIASLGVPADQLHRVMTVASLVQAESKLGKDGPKVARVIENRLKDGMPLQFDSTVHFIEQKRGTVTTTDEERRSDSPYNTYKVKGLPPGPVDSPGADAIKAALHPASGSWLYFVTVNQETGETLFADTYAEQQANEAKFRQWCAQNPGKC